MTTIMPPAELLRRAVVFIHEERQAHPHTPMDTLIDAAAMRFNLSPRDCAALSRLLLEEQEQGPNEAM